MKIRDRLPLLAVLCCFSALVAGLCHVEMLGDRQLFLEGHSGILSYGTEQIDVGAGSLILRVRGQNLTLRSMTDSEVRIFGKIDAVEYVR